MKRKPNITNESEIPHSKLYNKYKITIIFNMFSEFVDDTMKDEIHIAFTTYFLLDSQHFELYLVTKAVNYAKSASNSTIIRISSS